MIDPISRTLISSFAGAVQYVFAYKKEGGTPLGRAKAVNSGHNVALRMNTLLQQQSQQPSGPAVSNQPPLPNFSLSNYLPPNVSNILNSPNLANLPTFQNLTNVGNTSSISNLANILATSFKGFGGC